MLDDHQLLCRYATEGSEAAFAELVARYINLVYSTALRRANGDAQLAQDVAQMVFTDLACKARSLPKNVVLAGWLHRASRFAATQSLRTEGRRQAREQRAITMNALESESKTDWEQIRPLLDEALDELSPADRDAVLLRFFEQRSFGEVGQAIGTNEDAARKRISRALEKLQASLTRRGITTTATVLATAISGNAIQVAPIGLTAVISATATFAGVAAQSATAIAASKAIAMTTVQKALFATTFAVAIGLASYEAWQVSRLRAQVKALQQQPMPQPEPAKDALSSFQSQVAGLETQNDALAKALAQANADKARLEVEREQAKQSAALYQELVELANSPVVNSTNDYPTPRHLWTAFGRLGRISALSKEEDSKLSSEEKSALETARMKAIEGIPNLVKAFKYYDAAATARADSPAEDHVDQMACLLYGALNLDEPQFGEVYRLLQKSEQEAKQKGLTATNSAPEKAAAMNQVIEQFKVEVTSFLTPEQARICAEVLTHCQFEAGKLSINFNF